MILEPGDVITTGTPPGVGLGMKPPRYLKPGDVVTLGIEGLGRAAPDSRRLRPQERGRRHEHRRARLDWR